MVEFQCDAFLNARKSLGRHAKNSANIAVVEVSHILFGAIVKNWR